MEFLEFGVGVSRSFGRGAKDYTIGKAVTIVRNKLNKPKKGSGICTYGPASSVPLGVTLATKVEIWETKNKTRGM